MGLTALFWKTQTHPTTIPTPQSQVAIQPTQDNNHLDNSTQDTTNENATLSYKNLILGRWVFKQSLYSNGKVVSSFPFHLETEYFEDNTFLVQRKEKNPALSDVLDRNENGEWIIFSDGRLKRSYESCTETQITKKCKTVININKINFPDSNTLEIHYSTGVIDTFERL